MSKSALQRRIDTLIKQRAQAESEVVRLLDAVSRYQALIARYKTALKEKAIGR